MIALAQPPQAVAQHLSLAYLARDAGRLARSRKDDARPSLARQFAWQASHGQFARDVMGVELDAWQLEALQSETLWQLIRASRQSGKSTSASILVAHTALFRPGSLSLCIAPSQRQSKLLLRSVRGILLASRCIEDFPTSNVLEIELPNGSRVVGLPSKEATIRGYDAPDVVVIDEASKVPDDVFTAITPMLATSATHAKLWAISTPWGQRGWWFREWNGEDPEWARTTIRAHECGRITEEFLRRERARMGRLKFESEYLCEFVGTEHQLFPPEVLERIFRGEEGQVRPRWMPIVTRWGEDGTGAETETAPEDAPDKPVPTEPEWSEQLGNIHDIDWSE